MNFLNNVFAPILIFLTLLTACNNQQNSKAATSGGQKIAYVDPEEILPKMPEYIAAKSELEQLKAKLQKQMEDEQSKAQQYYAGVMSKVQSGSMAPAQQKAEEEKLMKMQEELQRKAVLMEEDMVKKEQEMTKPMYDKFNDAVKALAKANGYAYVFDKKMMIYSEGGEDATIKLKEKLGIK